jgi:two-component system cell cycle sensor histidine kinase/response regulator CckA
VESALRENGYLVTGAVDGRSAMEAFEKESGAFDLVLSDVVLPDRSGIDVVQAMLSQNVRLKVLLSSGYTDDKSQWEAIRKRGFRFMQKPFTLMGLLRAVRASIEEDTSNS